MKKTDIELAIRRSHRLLEYEATYATRIAKYRIMALMALHKRELTLAEGAELNCEAWLKDYVFNTMKHSDEDILLDRELEHILESSIECIKGRK